MRVTISNCGSDEYGRYAGGAAGDQTGGEWVLKSWYSRPWNVMLRFENPSVAALIAQMANAAAKNNLIGYDQNQRGTFWQHLAASNYDPAQITVRCEADCSSGTAAIAKGAGYRLGMQKLKDISPDAYTGNLRAVLKNAGATIYTDSKYLSGDAYLKAGDILLYEGHHVAIAVTNGSKSGGSGSSTVMPAQPVKVANRIIADGQTHANNFVGAGLVVDGEYGPLSHKAGIKCLQHGLNQDCRGNLAKDGIYGPATSAATARVCVRKGDTKYTVTALEILLMLRGYDPHGVECPGIFESGLDAAVRKYQKDHGLTVDGEAGKQTFTSLIS